MPSPTNQVIWSVSALNHEVKTILEKGIGRLWLEGEISNLSKPSSGHWYFSLKDQNAQIRVAMFKSKNNRIKFNAANGQQVLIKASVSLYEARGEFQVIAEHMEEAGSGKLMREYEALKSKLKIEGLFEPTFKQTIPRYPKKIGIITSPTGAAIRDTLSVLQRRSPVTDIIIYPCMVQGEAATAEIIKSLQTALIRNECDVLLMVRGGGSIEDLWCFNDEALARLIYESSIPIITGIGHEVDFTIADFVADFRAPTPSVAAESAAIDSNELKQQIDYKTSQLNQLIKQQLTTHQSQLKDNHQQLLKHHPKHAINELLHRLSLQTVKLQQTMQWSLNAAKQSQQQLNYRFNKINPLDHIQQKNQKLNEAVTALQNAIKNQHQQAQQRIQLHAQKLDTLSPLKTLARGYASVRKNQITVHSVQQLKVKDSIQIQLSDGQVSGTVNTIKVDK